MKWAARDYCDPVVGRMANSGLLWSAEVAGVDGVELVLVTLVTVLQEKLPLPMDVQEAARVPGLYQPKRLRVQRTKLLLFPPTRLAAALDGERPK